MRYVTLRCPKCKRKQKVKAVETDPATATAVEIQCPKCNAGDFDSPHFYNAQGTELDWETGQPFNAA